MQDTAALLFRSLQQTREYAVVVLDPQGLIADWLGAAERVFGYARSEIVGSPVSRLFTPEDTQRGFDRQELAIARGAGRAIDDRWHLRKDGSAVWVTGTVDAIRDEAGELLGFVKIARDRSDLRTQIDSLANELAACKAHTERTQAFLRTLGHELRNPLAPLQMSAQIIARLSDAPQVHHALETIEAQVGALRRLADDLMEVTRMEAGQVELRWAALDLRELVRQAAAGFEPLAAGQRLALVVMQPDVPMPVRVDAERMQQVLLNLLSNALKYTPAGGRIWVQTTQEGHEVVLRVEDTGMGIAPEVLPRIFELFTREAAAVERDPGGLGIGLAMVRQIVSLHGGSVQARSAGRGEGTAFTVRLPAAG
jgi:PAS domain S-box-containing protein